MKRRPVCGRGPYRSTNSGPAARAGTSSRSNAVRALSPSSFAFDHSAQGLVAGGAAKLAARAAVGACEGFFTARAFTARKFAIGCWALALAGLWRRRAGEWRCRGEVWLGRDGLATFGGAAASIPLALGLAFLLSVGGLTILAAGASPPPAPSGGSALRAAITGLGVGGMEGLLTSLEQTASLARPTSPLTGGRFAASWCWAQGSCELPTAKPRTRSPSTSAPRRLLGSTRPSWEYATFQLTADPRGFQAAPTGTT